MTPALTEEGVERMLRDALPGRMYAGGPANEATLPIDDDFLAQARAVLALVEAEREACAKLAEEFASGQNDYESAVEADRLAAAIRARRTK